PLVQETHGAASGRQHPGNKIESRTLAGPVRADKPHDLASFQRETDVVHGHQAAELLADRIDFQYQRASFRPFALGQGWRFGRWSDSPAFTAPRQYRPPGRKYWPNAVACVLQDQYHQHAKNDEFEVVIRIENLWQHVLQLIFKCQDQLRAQYGPPYAACAAHHRHEQILDSVVQSKGAGTNGALHMGI